MQSEFYNVALDRIRYSLVWESSTTLCQALQLQPTDDVLVISSAGCNALNVLLQEPRSVTAIDLNPVQNHLLHFKQHLILHHEPQVLRALLGLDGPAAVLPAWHALEPTLPEELRAYWAPFFESHAAGILPAGRLESYLLGFLPTLSPELQANVRRLIAFDSLTEQRRWFMDALHGTAFEDQFISYFDDANLSRGRDTKLFRYAPESGGEAFYRRLVRHVSTELLRDNFFFRFFFFGAENLPEAILPPCYQQQNFYRLRALLQQGKLAVVTGEATEFLFSETGQHISKASLSNIFEYVSPAEFQRTSRALMGRAQQPLRLVFWNLLQEHASHVVPGVPLDRSTSLALGRQPGACFYFRDVRVLDSALVPASVPAPVLVSAHA
ncbi:DUF3419 family protein [Hymenobacter oligotrophus]|uniref:DUF3419 family protein n=1 Tax=Hymenobacter oligotrophus TaxID=2319843 RepID=A0A3B7R393_9BACT|nr:DUF3419 family protein [Hymenobacter oligotrophus]AYA35819.1 DUF3419 family protein [Hymenobacter oligotrophus]